MENTKYEHLMKNLLIFFTLILLKSCNGQDKNVVTYPNKTIINNEKIDLNRFKNYPDVITEENEKNLPKMQDKLSDGTVINYSKWENKEDNYKTYYKKTITPPPPSLFFTIKEFYPSGIIKQHIQSFVGTLNIPPFYNSIITKEYDMEGKIIKTTNHSNFDKDVKLKLNDLLVLLQNEPLIRDVKPEDRENLSFYLFNQQISKEDVSADKIIKELMSNDNKGKILNANSDVERRNITISLENNVWKVTKDIYPRGFFDYIFDANSGKLLNIDYRRDQRP